MFGIRHVHLEDQTDAQLSLSAATKRRKSTQ